MSEAVSALQGARFDGFARVAEADLRGMITLRGDLGSAKLKAAATGISGTAFPAQGEVKLNGALGLCWMSPDEVLILCAYADVAGALDRIGTALGGTHHLAVDVSDARAVFTVAGVDAREVIAKLTPADVSPGGLQPGTCRRTRLAQVPAAFWIRDDDSFEVICFRSVARYVFDLLKTAAIPGSEVGYF